MRSMITLIVAAMLLSFTATAELQNVELDGTITIRGNYQMLDAEWSDSFEKTWIEQRTLLGVRADFTDDVSAYIQFDNYSIWGEDFRSMDWESGYDDRATIEYNDVHDRDDYDLAEVEIYQAYIQATDMWGTPLDLTIGRQELVFGNEFLLGNNDTGMWSFGLSWDAIRLDYNTDMFTITGAAAKIEENVFGDLGAMDNNLYLLYGSYTGMEDIVIDAYVLYLQDYDWDHDNLYTFGLRGAGTIGAFDFDAEVAYQSDDEDGSSSDEYFAATAELGYTLDMAWMPRLYVGATFIEDDFYRLFSDVEYLTVRGDRHSNMEDLIVYSIGGEVQPTENIAACLDVSYLEEEDDSDTIGVETELEVTYSYSEDLDFTLIYAHLFADDWWGEDQDYVGIISTISF